MKKSNKKNRPNSTRISKNDVRRLSFDFRYLDECAKNGQTLAKWEECQLLSKLITRLKAISDTDLYNASSSDSIQIYNSYPETSKFELSDTFKQQIESMHENLFWGVIKNIDTSNTARVAGFLADSIFYITFLDKDHLFFR